MSSFLGIPTKKIKKWIKDHDPKTSIEFDDGTTQRFDWSGELINQKLIDVGLKSDYNTWLKNPVEARIG
jgi:hypothetical protein